MEVMVSIIMDKVVILEIITSNGDMRKNIRLVALWSIPIQGTQLAGLIKVVSSWIIRIREKVGSHNMQCRIGNRFV